MSEPMKDKPLASDEQYQKFLCELRKVAEEWGYIPLTFSKIKKYNAGGKRVTAKNNSAYILNHLCLRTNITQIPLIYCLNKGYDSKDHIGDSAFRHVNNAVQDPDSFPDQCRDVFIRLNDIAKSAACKSARSGPVVNSREMSNINSITNEITTTGSESDITELTKQLKSLEVKIARIKKG